MISSAKEANPGSAVSKYNDLATMVGDGGAQLRLLRRIEVQSKTKISRSALYAKLNPNDASYDPDFPVPVRVSANTVRWVESEVDAYIASLPRARRLNGGAK